MKGKLNYSSFRKSIASSSGIQVVQFSKFRSILLALLGLTITLNFQACQEKDQESILTGSLKTFPNWWTSTEDISPNNAWTRRITNVSSQVGRSAIPVKSFGFTVRCVRD